MQLNATDWAIVFVSIVISFVPAIVLAKRAGTSTAEFFTSGRAAPWWLIGVSMVAARLLKFQPLFGLLTGGATAICGASAALALSAALPAHPKKDQATLFTVIGVSALSTLAMVLYPMVVQALGYSPLVAGKFLGATIHDVAQVVGADVKSDATVQSVRQPGTNVRRP